MKLFKKKTEKEKKIKKKKLSKKEKKRIKIERNKIKEEKLRIKNEKKKNRKKINIDFKTILGGMFVGIANIIPGVSGGTMLVIFNLFDKLAYSISDIFKKNTTTRKESILFLFKIIIGCGIGIIAFAKIIGYTLEHFEAETIFLFMGLILFSVPLIIKDELKKEKFNIIFFIIGFALIIGLQILQKNAFYDKTNTDFGIIHFIIMTVLGIIGGMTMIFPGVSGSMVLLVLGKYELIRSYIDKLTSFDFESIISLIFFGIGAILGIVLSAKLTHFLLNKYRGKTVSLILGFIIASALILPFNLENYIKFTTIKTCSLLIWFTIGGMIIYYINRLKNKEK